MTYRTAFDISQTAFPFDPSLLIPLLLTAIGTLLVFAPRLMNALLPGGIKGPARVVFSWFYFLFACTLSVLMVSSYYGETLHLHHGLKSGQAALVEGCVATFHRMPESGHDEERITVADRAFTYSDFTITPAFHRTESHGGPIHADSRVRIQAVGDAIARLDVADHACPPATLN